jgi:hypothetical protein
VAYSGALPDTFPADAAIDGFNPMAIWSRLGAP